MGARVQEPQFLGVGALDALDVQLQDVLETWPQQLQQCLPVPGGVCTSIWGGPCEISGGPSNILGSPYSLVDGWDVALGHDGTKAQDDVDAEEHGDAVVAVADICVHVLLNVFGGSAASGGPPQTPRAPQLTRNMAKVLPMTALNRSCALGPVTMKKSHRNKYSRQLLSSSA